ncbi:hypothetical protein L202_03832 [Cryptococcus amylolentus CBS 6039]|uniref:Uncharacterized protein n=2 Tax=Cryptococcus amylolentus TaxID=104669 RepID=A0A1E3HUE7_9TREE|nr:hypothetical protein L202_03832 [Cryptococcus amylolentus CBS 6039]ODN79958.1 hypothetical protein L202_03832 [Cryptococcus amylolentus CBS 6039]ODO08202.1 hypothetical protein I350_03791 [Cryptococcus amylolentus CBS 6273]
MALVGYLATITNMASARTQQQPPLPSSTSSRIFSPRVANNADSDIVPSILYDPTPISPVASSSSNLPRPPVRGRTHSRTYEWYEAVQKEREDRKKSKSSRSSGSSSSGSERGSVSVSRGERRSRRVSEDVDVQTINAHHTLPDVLAEVGISPDPILYLPPLLSPLPEHAHDHAPEYDEDEDHPHPHFHSHSHSRPGKRDDALISVKEVNDNRHGLIEEGEQVDPLRDFSTRLPHIDPASLALHQALHHFKPLSNAYASLPYDKAFNWSSLSLPKSAEREWYCVVFRSRRKPESANLSLYKADREAHEEAVQNGGLILYWYGVPDSTGLNLATCIWQSRRHAIKAISGPKHMSAMKQTEGAYETYSLERWVLKKEVGKRGVSLKKWEGGDVGW